MKPLSVKMEKGGPYEWPKIGETEPSTKYGFIKRATFGGEIYPVGSGFYVEDYLLTKNTGNTDEVPIPIRKVRVNELVNREKL